VSPRSWTLFAAVSIIWGTPYLFIKIAVDGGVPPAFVAWSRIVLGAAVLLVLAWRAGVLHGLRGRMRWLALFALAEVAVPFPLIAAGERHVDSSLAAILIATAPLFVALLSLRFDATERPTRRRLVGLVVGLVGVVALVGIQVAGESAELFGAAAILLAAVGYAVGPMVLKLHLADLDARVSMGMSLLLAGIALTPIMLLDVPTAFPPADAIGAILALGLLCTATGMVLFGMLIAAVGAGRALVITYINPIVAVILGMIILDERPGASAFAGLVLILVGSALSTSGRQVEH
jgi:drug/metabolite transporter (DMT)-like permease